MNVLSLFDGMSCGQIALERVGIKVDRYYASELDKYAIQVTQKNYPDTKQLGDVNNWREWDIDWSSIDLLQGGSPCQGFSFAGKQLAFDDPRSKLFFVYVDILNHIRQHNPNVKFLLENVRMKKEYLDVISEYLGVQPVLINSALVSAQDRKRYYWTNICEIEQPEDRGVILYDILLDNPDSKYNLTEKNLAHLNREFGSKGKLLEQDKKSCTLTAAMGTGGGNVPYIDEKYYMSPEWNIWWNKNAQFQLQKKYSSVDADKGITMTARQYASWNGNFVKRLGHYNNGGQGRIRKLTPIECERLQTVPDNYTDGVSDSQRYKMLGNGWTVDVIAHIYKNLV